MVCFFWARCNSCSNFLVTGELFIFQTLVQRRFITIDVKKVVESSFNSCCLLFCVLGVVFFCVDVFICVFVVIVAHGDA